MFSYLRTYSGTNTVHIPLSNLSRADLSLRPELGPALSRAQIELDNLITLSHLQPSGKHVPPLDPHKTRWILVDHNALQGELGKIYSGQVIGAIDHHDEENQVPKDCMNEPRIITKSGSCTSLVVEYCREAWDALSKKSSADETAAWDEELAHLALAPILIDTANLKDSSKVTPTDTKAVEYLESKLKSSSARYSRDDYFSQISAAKTNIDGLEMADILRKDYKQWTESNSVNLGISSATKPLSLLLSKDSAFPRSLIVFAAGRKLSLYALMTAYTSESGEFKRELVLAYDGADGMGVEAAKAFESNAAETLGLKSLEGAGLSGSVKARAGEDTQDSWGYEFRYWVQEKVENSRKQVAPLLRKALQDTLAALRNQT